MKTSAGYLLYRTREVLQVLLVHPGGPFWAKKDLGAWSIPKGEVAPGEEARAAARREFGEELGTYPTGEGVYLGEARQRSAKRVVVFAAPGDFDPATLSSNQFELEWPPRSKRLQSFPEVDRAEWFSIEDARQKILAGQQVFLYRLLGHLGSAQNEQDEQSAGP